MSRRTTSFHVVMCVCGAVAVALLVTGPLMAGTTAAVFGPVTYVRQAGPPQQFVEAFSLASPDASIQLRVINGDENGDHRLSSSTVTINGVEVIHNDDLNQQVFEIIRPLSDLALENTLEVRLTSNPGGFLIVEVFATLESIEIAPASFTLTSGNPTQQLTVLGNFSDLVQRDLTDASTGTTYDSSNPSVAEVSANGLITAVANGTAIITARHDIHEATANVTVTLGPAQIADTSPRNGEQGVAVTRESIIIFSQAVTAVQNGAISAVAASEPIAGHHVLSGDGKRVWFFYDAELPGSTQVTVTVDGSLITDALGRLVDVDGDETPGGSLQFSFTTINLTPVTGTNVMGRIFDSDLTDQGCNIPLEGVTITVDGRPDVVAVTDNMGNFELVGTPAGTFFVHIDGGTEVNSMGLSGPLTFYYPTVGKPFKDILAGQDNLLPFDIHLPKVMKANVQTNIDPTQEIVITSGDPELAGVQITLPAASLFRDDGQPPTFVGIASVPPDRLPAPLPAGVDPPLVFTFQSDATNLRVPAPVRFPNSDGLPPGEKLNLLSFNHDTGRFELAGAMTVDPTGSFIETDPGVGIPAPGWHLPCQCDNNEGNGGGCDGGGCDDGCQTALEKALQKGASLPLPSLEGLTIQAIFGSVAATAFGLFGFGSALVDLYTCINECLFPSGAGGGSGGSTPPIEDFAHPDQPVPGGTPIPPNLPGGRTSIVVAAVPIVDEILGIAAPFVLAGEPLDEDAVQAIEDRSSQLDGLVNGDFDMAFAGWRNELLDLADLHQVDLTTPLVPNTGRETRFVVEVRNVTVLDDLPEVIQRGVTNADGSYSFFTSTDPNLEIQVYLFDPTTWTIGNTRRVNGALNAYTLAPLDETAQDIDNDGLPDVAEYVLSTSIAVADTDGDGILDGPEVRAGTDPLDGGFAVTGIVGSVDTPGFSHEVCVRNDLTYVADGPAGLSIFNIFNPTEPTLVVRVDTPGTAVDVDCGDELVAVADADAGVAIIDITDPPNAAIAHQVALPDGAQARCVSTVLDTAFVGDNLGRLHLIEMSSGVILGRVNLAPFTVVDDLAVTQRTLYALTTATSGGGGQLIALDIGPGLPSELGRIAASHSNERTGPFPRRRLFADTTNAFVSTFGGFSGFNISDPTNMSQTCSNIVLAAVRGGVANGSGALVLAAGGSTNANAQVFTDFPASCNTTLTAFDTPGNAHGVGMNNGLVYLADGEAGIQVVNIISTDVNGIPPTGSLTTSAVGGVAAEGGRIFVSGDVADDVQVRNVEFFVDGDRFTVDGNFPFEFQWPVPVGMAGSVASFTAVARDTGGNELALGPIDLTIIADTEPPVITVNAPIDGATFFLFDVIPISVTATDNVGVASVSFQVDGIDVAARRTSLTTWQIEAPATLGMHTLTALAVDSAGLLGTSVPVSFTVRHQAHSREFSVYNDLFDETVVDAFSREFSVFNNTFMEMIDDAFSREFSVFNDTFVDEILDAFSREFSVHNQAPP